MRYGLSTTGAFFVRIRTFFLREVSIMQAETLLVIQRISDSAILCTPFLTGQGRPSSTKWFSPDYVPDGYGYVTIREAALHAENCCDAESQNRMLPKIVADCAQEFYEKGQLRFLKLPPEAIEPPTPTLPQRLQ
jgi:hypothetical protein